MKRKLSHFPASGERACYGAQVGLWSLSDNSLCKGTKSSFSKSGRRTFRARKKPSQKPPPPGQIQNTLETPGWAGHRTLCGVRFLPPPWPLAPFSQASQSHASGAGGSRATFPGESRDTCHWDVPYRGLLHNAPPPAHMARLGAKLGQNYTSVQWRFPGRLTAALPGAAQCRFPRQDQAPPPRGLSSLTLIC